MRPARGASGVSHDFNFFNAAGSVWNGSAFVTWADADYASYRVAATETGTSGRFPPPTLPTGTDNWELRVRGASLALSYVVWEDDLTSANAETAALEVVKIQRAATAVTAGGPTEKHLESASGATLETVREVIDGDA